MNRVYVDTKSLPDTLQRALAAAGFNRPIVAIEPRETDCFRTGAYGDGYQAFTVLVDLDTGETTGASGAWGGGNDYSFGSSASAAVDHDETQRPLPPNGAVIHGQHGGGKPTSAHVTIHPSRAAKYLPAPTDTLSPRLRTLLAVYKCYNSRGRAEWFERHGTGTEDELAQLVSLGLIKRNKAGAVTVTADGRNATSNRDDNRIYDGWLKAAS